MTLAVVSNSTAQGNGALSPSVPSGSLATDIIYIFYAGYGVANTLTPPSGFSSIYDQNDGSSWRLQAWSKQVGSDSGSYSMSTQGGNLGGAVLLRCSDANPTNLDAYCNAKYSYGSNDVYPNSLTSNLGGIYVGWGGNSASYFTGWIGTGLTSLGSNGQYVRAGYRTIAASTLDSYSHVYAYDGAGGSGVAAVVIKELIAVVPYQGFGPPI